MSAVTPTKLQGRRKGTVFGNGKGKGWGGGGHGHFHRPSPVETYRLGMFFGLASISMLFIGLTSAYIVRHGSEPIWRSIAMPPLLLVNTAVLAASSFSMEKARRTSRIRSFNLWLRTTVVLGAVFVAGQLAVWRQFSDTGIYLSTNPHSSFFYLLTGLHGLHLLGGILALSFLALKTARSGIADIDSPFVEATTFYWHFMGTLWVYLLMLLFNWS